MNVPISTVDDAHSKTGHDRTFFVRQSKLSPWQSIQGGDVCSCLICNLINCFILFLVSQCVLWHFAVFDYGSIPTPMIRSDDFHFQSFVERYVATLFAQCRQIATVFENFHSETDEVVSALKATPELKQPETTLIDEAGFRSETF